MTDAAMLPEVIATSKRLLALVALGDRMGTLPIDKDLIYLIDRVDAQLLPNLAWQFHLTYFEGWGAARTEPERRRIIRQSIAIHRKKGTPWAIKQALRFLGDIDVRIIDRMAQRDAYAPYHPLRLDGSWTLDGSQRIRPIEIVVGIPQIQHWARFFVITPHDDVLDPSISAAMRKIVDEWKPVRSWPSYLSWLLILLGVPIDISGSSIFATLIHDYHYPWCGHVIGEDDDVRWPLGRDGHVVRLPQPFGTFRLGQMIGGHSSWHLRGCRIVSHLIMASHGAHIAYGLPTIGETWRRLDGTWRIGERASALMGHLDMATGATLSAPSRASVGYGAHIRLDYPATPERLTRMATLVPWRRLDGRWSLGDVARHQPFGFALRRGEPILATSHMTAAMRDSMPANPVRLAQPNTIKMGRRLDGCWRVGQSSVEPSSHTMMARQSLISAPSQASIGYGAHIRLDYPATPERLTRMATLVPWRRLDGRWSLGGVARRAPFGFALRRGEPILAASHMTAAVRDSMPASPERLAQPITIKMGRRRHIDGSWHLGDPFLTGPRLGTFRLPFNDTAGGVDIRDARHLPVDGTWRIGGPAAPLFRFNIQERAHHV